MVEYFYSISVVASIHYSYQYIIVFIMISLVASTCLLLLGVTMDTRNTVASSNQLVGSSGVGELL